MEYKYSGSEHSSNLVATGREESRPIIDVAYVLQQTIDTVG